MEEVFVGRVGELGQFGRKKGSGSILFGTNFACPVKRLCNCLCSYNTSKSFVKIKLALCCALCFNSVYECKT